METLSYDKKNDIIYDFLTVCSYTFLLPACMRE